MAEAPEDYELQLPSDFVTVPLHDDEHFSLSSPEALLALDHMRIAAGQKSEEDPAIRAQVERAARQDPEDIPLVCHKDPGPEAWDLGELQRTVQSAYSAFVEYTRPRPGEDGWFLVEHSHPRREWSLLEKLGEDGTYYFRVEAAVKAQAGRVAMVVRDVNFETRCHWDGLDLRPVHLQSPSGQTEVLPALRRRGERIIRPYRDSAKQQRMERKGRAPMDRCFEIVETFIHPPVALPGVSMRRMLGVQWGKYTPSQREYVLLTSTLEDVSKDEAIFGCPESCVDVRGVVGMRIIAGAGHKQQCHVTMVVAVNPGGSIPTAVIPWGREKLLYRAELIEAVCQDETFRKIYGKRPEAPTSK